MGKPWPGGSLALMPVTQPPWKRDSVMSTTIDLINAEAFNDRVTSVLEALAARGLTAHDVRAEFLSACDDIEAAESAWNRLYLMDDPTATELALYAKVLQVNTTWLLTGDVRFINPALMADTCLCTIVPEEYHFVHFGATEPGSTREFSPDCLLHGNPMSPELLERTVLVDLVLGRKLPRPTIDLTVETPRGSGLSVLLNSSSKKAQALQ